MQAQTSIPSQTRAWNSNSSSWERRQLNESASSPPAARPKRAELEPARRAGRWARPTGWRCQPASRPPTSGELEAEPELRAAQKCERECELERADGAQLAPIVQPRRRAGGRLSQPSVLGSRQPAPAHLSARRCSRSRNRNRQCQAGSARAPCADPERPPARQDLQQIRCAGLIGAERAPSRGSRPARRHLAASRATRGPLRAPRGGPINQRA